MPKPQEMPWSARSEHSQIKSLSVVGMFHAKVPLPLGVEGFWSNGSRSFQRGANRSARRIDTLNPEREFFCPTTGVELLFQTPTIA